MNGTERTDLKQAVVNALVLERLSQLGHHLNLVLSASGSLACEGTLQQNKLVLGGIHS